MSSKNIISSFPVITFSVDRVKISLNLPQIHRNHSLKISYNMRKNICRVKILFSSSEPIFFYLSIVILNARINKLLHPPDSYLHRGVVQPANQNSSLIASSLFYAQLRTMSSFEVKHFFQRISRACAPWYFEIKIVFFERGMLMV